MILDDISELSPRIEDGFNLFLEHAIVAQSLTRFDFNSRSSES